MRISDWSSDVCSSDLTTNDDVLVPHTETILQMLAQANPVLAAIAARAESISGLFDDVVFFNEVFPTVQANGQVLIQAWLDPLILVGGAENLDPTDPAGLLTTILNGVDRKSTRLTSSH